MQYMFYVQPKIEPYVVNKPLVLVKIIYLRHILYKLRLSEKLRHIEQTTIERLYTKIVKAIHEASYKSLEVEETIFRNKTYCWNNNIETIWKRRVSIRNDQNIRFRRRKILCIRISREVKKDIIKAKK